MSITASIIIPMYNPRKTILETLQALENQQRKDFEVIVVDDGSTDGSGGLVQEYGLKSRLALRYTRQANAGPAKARNVGAGSALGNIVIFLDSDCVPPPDWLDAMVKPLSNGVSACSCGYRVRNKDKWVARYVDYEIAWRRSRMLKKNVDSLVSNSLGIKKSVFDTVGGFDCSYTMAASEDFDLSYRLHKMGYEQCSVDETFVYHYHPESLKRYLRQQHWRGYWRVRTYLTHPGKIASGDSYTGLEAQVGFITAHLAFLSVPLVLVWPIAPALGIGLLWMAHLPLGVWAFRREKKFLIVAPIVAALRSVSGTLGAWHYVISRPRWPRKAKRPTPP